MYKTRENKSDGFSIIEVMIVLAVAAVIMVIVFLAVPALQRNNRNTQRRTDVNNLVAAVNEYASATNQLPITLGTIASGAKLGYYSVSAISLYTNVSSASGTGTGIPGPGDTTVQIITNAKCDDAVTKPPVSAGNKQFIAWYSVETKSGIIGQCVES